MDERFAYLILPSKLKCKTWEMLKDANLATRDPDPVVKGSDFHDWRMHKSLGLLIMAILARVCAGTLKEMVTDEGQAYEAWTRELTKRLAGDYRDKLPDPQKNQKRAEDARLLVTVTTETLSARSLDLRTLIRHRKQEGNGKGVLHGLRSKYAEQLQIYLNNLQTCDNMTDYEEYLRQFKEAMKNDLRSLNHELGSEVDKVIWSRGMGLALVFAAGTFFAPQLTALAGVGAWASAVQFPAGVLGIFDLKKTGKDYQAAREGVLLKHPMSWLYTTRRLPLR